MGFFEKMEERSQKITISRKFDKNNNFYIFNCLKITDFGVNYLIDIKMKQQYQLQ